MSATLDLVEAPSLAPTKPKWWLRWHSWLFVVQVVANVGLFWWCWSLLRYGIHWQITGGFILGQLFLLGMWLALGGLHFAARYSLVIGLFACGAWLATSQLGPWRVENSVFMIVLGGMIVLVFNAALMPLRSLIGWRVDFDPAYHDAARRPSMQIGIRDVLAWTVVCALPLGLSRLLLDDLALDVSISAAIAALVTMVVAAPSALAVVNRRRTGVWLAVAAVWTGIVVSIEAALLRFFVGNNLDALALNSGLLASVAGNLFVMRMFGMHLFRLRYEAAAS